MIEIKKREISIHALDGQDIMTALEFNEMPTVRFRIDRNEEEDEPVVNPDGSVSYCRTVNVNGTQWRIPTDAVSELPEPIYNILKESEDIKNRYRPKPVNFTKIDMGYGL